MRKKESFLSNRTKKRKFDAFNIINNMLFIGVFVLFVYATAKCISDMINSVQPTSLIVPLLMRISAILLTILPYVLSLIFKINYPKIVTIMYYLFLFFSLFLGSFMGVGSILYNRFVHTYGGLFLGIISMFFVQLLNKNRQKQIHPMLVFILVFAFSMTFEACWEIWEYTGDKLFGMNMQNSNGLVGRDALRDTMFDLICNFIGAIISATICAVCSYKFNDFIDYFRITKKESTKNVEIEEIEE